MASRRPKLSVSVSPRAANQLDEIYRYNFQKRGKNAATRYVELLNEKIDRLAVDYGQGKLVERRPDLRYLILKKRSGGDGHIAVYFIDDAAALVDVMFIFHTKQDWENNL